MKLRRLAAAARERKIEGVEELLDVEEQRRSGGGCPRAPGGGDLSGRRLPPDDVGGGLPLSRAEMGRVAGEADLPGAGAAFDHRAEHAAER